MYLLDNPIKGYAWGNTSAIPRLLKRSPNGQPQAELWLGAHPSDPSKCIGEGQRLDHVIAANPTAALGRASVERFGPTLPFLLKVLAAAKPLSLQAHPSLEQARAGFERENAQGLALDAPTRNYKDGNHKPELICAMTPFQALCGFRALPETLALFRTLGLPIATLERLGLKAYFHEVMTAPIGAQQALANQAAVGCAKAKGFDVERSWALKLSDQYPGDVGIIGALLLNTVTLLPGEALYLPAGNLHAYLEGVGIELMASSDNVLRGGLTTKHIDGAELSRVLDFTDGPARPMLPDNEGVYRTPADDFELTRISLRGTGSVTNMRRGADVFLVTSGYVQVSSTKRSVSLSQGHSLFVGAEEGLITLSGSGECYRATVGRF